MPFAVATAASESAGAGWSADPCQGGLDQRSPWRIGGGLIQHRAPDCCGIGLTTILFRGKAQEIAGLHLIGIERQPTLELGLRFGRDHAACRRRNGFAEICPSFGAVAIIGDAVAKGPDRVIKPSKAQQNRSQDIPAAPVGRILFQMLLDLIHQGFERLRGRRRPAAKRKRKVAEPRRPQRKIDSDRQQWQSDQSQRRRGATPRHAWFKRHADVLIRDRKKATPDLDARGLGLGLADQPAGDVTVDLLELIGVDDSLPAAGV